MTILHALFQNLHTDVAEPHLVAVVLHADESFVLVAATVVEKLESGRPSLFREFALLQHLRPFRSP